MATESENYFTYSDADSELSQAAQKTLEAQGISAESTSLGNSEGITTGIGDSQIVGSYAVEEIGKPFRFTDTVDPEERAYRFISTKMNIIDLYPCNYAQAYAYDSSQGKSAFKYAVGYEKAMTRYRTMVKDYLGEGTTTPSAIRLFLTDDTVVTDGISTAYRPNWFQNKADTMSNLAQNITDLGRSISSSGYHAAVDSAISAVNTAELQDHATTVLGLNNAASEITGGLIENLKAGAAIVLKGQKLSLPKIWDSSNYTPTFSISTKLFSPYGHPSAIKEFIIRPLVLMALMGMPHTEDFVSYGKPFALTIRSWGTAYLTLGGITSITLQRGGNETAYSIYKQPLIVNVNLEFTSLVDGIAAFATDNSGLTIDPYEQNSFSSVGDILTLNSSDQSIDGSRLPTVMPTLGGLIRSMQPVMIDNLTTGYGPTKGTRETTMVGGNGSIFSTVSLSNTSSDYVSEFNSAYQYATDNALVQALFGDFFDGEIGDTIGELVSTAGDVWNTVDITLKETETIANILSGGQFAGTDFANGINDVQALMQGSAGTATGALTTAGDFFNATDNALNAAGSLLELAV